MQRRSSTRYIEADISSLLHCLGASRQLAPRGFVARCHVLGCAKCVYHLSRVVPSARA